jgi:nitrite reductase/ring-hydroxylating ferredoxin subunit
LANVDGEILTVGGECSHDGVPLPTGSVFESPAVSAIESHSVRVDGDDIHLA